MIVCIDMIWVIINYFLKYFLCFFDLLIKHINRIPEYIRQLFIFASGRVNKLPRYVVITPKEKLFISFLNHIIFL